MLKCVFRLGCLSAGLLAFAAPARAQGCIMCYESAAAASKGVQEALRNGVLTLLIPVALLLIIMALLVWRSARFTRAAGNSSLAADNTSL